VPDSPGDAWSAWEELQLPSKRRAQIRKRLLEPNGQLSVGRSCRGRLGTLHEKSIKIEKRLNLRCRKIGILRTQLTEAHCSGNILPSD
jgi:hypothetical protein